MKTNPKVTISIPSYNYGRFIGRTIESVLAQDFEDYEVLVIDDASRDNTTEVVHRYADPRLRFIQNPVNIGQFATINKALARGQGDYFINLASDDVWFPGLLRREVDLLEAHPALVAIHSSEYCIDAEDRKLTINTAPYAPMAPGFDALRSFFQGGWFFSFSSCMVRRDALLRVGGFDREFGEFADSAMFARMCCQGHVAFVKDCLVGYRLHGTSICDQMFARSEEFFRPQREFIERVFAWEEVKASRLEEHKTEAIAELAKLMLKRAHLARLAGGRQQVWQLYRDAWSLSPRAATAPALWIRALVSWLLPRNLLRHLQTRKRARVLACEEA